ncbi:MAG: hypothetical protein D3916_07290, partial [Candidatus Electrothrix sp. MAN1_4]|nr:hypothetical protein [Candidatus Electrothrix sp. MAN1_4]
MENKTAPALILATILYVPPLYAATNSPLTQLSAGNQSPVINANNATFHYGLTETTLNASLEQHEDRIIKKLLAASGDKKERLLLEKQLKAVQEQKANLKKALEKEIQRRKNADEALAKLHGQLPPARLEEAAKLLQAGDTTAAEQLFEEVVRNEGKAVA